MNSQYRFLLVAPIKEKSTERIITEIQRNKLYQVATVETVLTARTYLNTGSYNCLVFDVDTLSNNALASIGDLREMGYSVPIIVFSDRVNKETHEKIKKLPRISLIEKPFESKDVWGICEKILQGRPVYQRIFRRYQTAQVAAVEKTLTGEIYTGSILNLSRGGAYMELSSGHILPGDLLRVSVHSKDTARQFDIDAEVIWSKTPENSNHKSRLGLKFMKSEDVYRTLLTRI